MARALSWPVRPARSPGTKTALLLPIEEAIFVLVLNLQIIDQIIKQSPHSWRLRLTRPRPGLTEAKSPLLYESCNIKQYLDNINFTSSQGQAQSLIANASKKRTADDLLMPQQIMARFKSKADFREYLEVQ